MNANTWVDVYRGTTVDSFGDEEDDNSTPIHEGIPIWIKEKDAEVHRSDSQTPRIVRCYVGRCTPGTDIQPKDRLRDVRNGRIYLVDSTSPDALGIAGQRPRLRIKLRALAPRP